MSKKAGVRREAEGVSSESDSSLKPRASRLILIVEDDPDTMRGYEVLLRARGYRIAGAINGVAAVREVLVQEPGLVILDLGLPAGSGFDFLEWLRSKQSTLPVIVVSGLDARDMALALGAAAYRQKPCDADELLALIEKALGDTRT